MKNKMMKKENSIIRILDVRENKVLIIDCIKKTMPVWIDKTVLNDYELCSGEGLDYTVREIDSLSAAEKRIMHEMYTLIAGILPFVSDERMRNYMISKISEQMQVSKQTVRKYLCLYLVYQNMSVLAPNKEEKKRELTQDEKNIRWALNKFFYTKNRNSLMTAYMITFFPEFYPDELVYSLLSRYYSKSGYSAYIFAAEDLYENKFIRPDVEFINPLKKEVLDIITKNTSMESIIKDHTMFPYYGRFIKQERRLR